MAGENREDGMPDQNNPDLHGKDWERWRGAMTSRMDNHDGKLDAILVEVKEHQRSLIRSLETHEVQDDRRFTDQQKKIEVLDKKLIRYGAYAVIIIGLLSLVVPPVLKHVLDKVG